MSTRHSEPQPVYQAVVIGTALVFVAWLISVRYYAEAFFPDPPFLSGLSVPEARAVSEQYAASLHRRLVLLMSPGICVLIVCGMAFLRTGVMALRFGEFPPPGCRVLWRQKVASGSMATTQATMSIGFGFAALFIAILQIVGLIRGAA